MAENMFFVLNEFRLRGSPRTRMVPSEIEPIKILSPECLTNFCFTYFLCHENVVDLDTGYTCEAVSSSQDASMRMRRCVRLWSRGWGTFTDTWEGGRPEDRDGNCLRMYICICFDSYECDLVDERQIVATANTPWPV